MKIVSQEEMDEMVSSLQPGETVVTQDDESWNCPSMDAWQFGIVHADGSQTWGPIDRRAPEDVAAYWRRIEEQSYEGGGND